jgi:hypothetical protein
MKRIGREPTPVERSLTNALERPEAAEYHGRCLCEAREGGAWSELSSRERQSWIETALREMEEYARSYPVPDPPPPSGGGLPMPNEKIA